MNNTKAFSPTAEKARNAAHATMAAPVIPGGLVKACERWYNAMGLVRDTKGNVHALEAEDEAWSDWCDSVDRHGRTGTEFDPRVMIAQQDRLF